MFDKRVSFVRFCILNKSNHLLLLFDQIRVMSDFFKLNLFGWLTSVLVVIILLYVNEFESNRLPRQTCNVAHVELVH